jgi:fibronectin-binding protein A
MVLPRTPPSPTPPPTLLFNSRVETPASWPPSDDMGIETHTPIYVPSRSPSPGTTSWAPITVPSRSPSPFWPGGPRPTPEKGVDAIPVASMGSNPGSPIPGTPEYNYDLTSPPSPRDPSPDPSASPHHHPHLPQPLLMASAPSDVSTLPSLSTTMTTSPLHQITKISGAPPP